MLPLPLLHPSNSSSSSSKNTEPQVLPRTIIKRRNAARPPTNLRTDRPNFMMVLCHCQGTYHFLLHRGVRLVQMTGRVFLDGNDRLISQVATALHRTEISGGLATDCPDYISSSSIPKQV